MTHPATPRLTAILVALALVAGCAVRSSDPSSALPSATSGSIPVFSAGTRGLLFSDNMNGSDTWHAMASASAADTASREVGIQHAETLPTTHDGAPALLLIKSSESRGATTFGDTLLMLRAGFQPVWERMHSGKQTKVIQYATDRVQQQTLVGDSLVKTLDKRFAHAPFGFNQLELLMRSLPFREGYRVILPLYSEGDDSVEMDTIAVLGLDRGPTPRWRVRFADPAITTVFTLDTLARQLLTYDVSPRGRPGRFWLRR